MEKEGEKFMSYMVTVTERGKLEVCLQVKNGHDAKTAGRLQKYVEMLGEKVCQKQRG